MTFAPEQIGDKGQRFQAEYLEAGETKDDPAVWLPIGWTETEEGANEMCAIWSKRPSTLETRVADRWLENRREKSNGVSFAKEIQT